MKKAIMIIICAIYIASIAVVNFFGLEVAIFQGFTYVDQIEITTLTVINGGDSYEISPHKSENENGVDEISYRFEHKPYDYTDPTAINPNMVKINYAIRPDNADNKKVDFVYDADGYEGLVEFNKDLQTVIFLNTTKSQKFTITVSTTDGHNVKKRISILCIVPRN